MIWKKPVFVLVLFCLLQTGRAQMLKNTLMTGGSLGFQYSSDHENYVNTATFNFTPLLGGFIAKNCVLGVAPVIMYTRSSGGFNIYDTVNGKPLVINQHLYTSQTSLGLGPFFRYYVKLMPQRLYLFIHASPSIMATWDTYSSNTSNPTSRTISAFWDLGPGLSVMLTKSVAVELSLYYQGMYHRSAQFVNGNLLGNPGSPYVDNGMVFNVGFQVYLDRNKKMVEPEGIK